MTKKEWNKLQAGDVIAHSKSPATSPSVELLCQDHQDFWIGILRTPTELIQSVIIGPYPELWKMSKVTLKVQLVELQ